MNILFLVYGFVIGVLAFLFWKLITDRPRKDSQDEKEETVACEVCGTVLLKDKAQEVKTSWSFFSYIEKDYYCELHKRIYTFRDAKCIPFKYFDWVEIDSMKVYRHENNISEPQDFKAPEPDIDMKFAEAVKKATQKMGKKGLKAKK